MASELPRWNNVGVSPPELLKNTGYQKGDKIPFQYMNWFMHRSYKALEELQISKVEQAALVDFREELLNQISNRVLVFDSTSSMRANLTLSAGAVIETLGYYATGDGGGARYLIVDSANPDGFFELRMTNGLVARLLPNYGNTVNIRQLGARPQNGETKYDCKQYVDAYLAYVDRALDTSSRLKMYIPSGIWCFSPTTLFNRKGFSITGDIAIPHSGSSITGTIINALNDNQAWVWDGGGTTRPTYNFELGYLTFSACLYEKNGNDYVVGTHYNVTDNVLGTTGLNHGFFHPMTFTNFNGTALELTSVRDTRFERLTFRNIGDFEKPILRMAYATEGMPQALQAMINVNVGLIEFENVAGDLIQYNTGSNAQNNTIDTIHVKGVPFGTTIPVTDAAYNDLTSIKMSVIRLNGALTNLTIGKINLTDFATHAAVNGGTQYIYDTVIGTYANLVTMTMKVNSLNTNVIGKDYSIIRNIQNQPNARSTFIFGEVIDASTSFRGNYNVTRFPSIYVNTSISKTFGGRDLLRGSWIPARDAIRRVFLGTTNFSGMLQRAVGAESPDELIVRPNTWLANGNDEIFYLKNNKFSDLRMRFKAEEAASINFRIYERGNPDVFRTVTLVGTGDWTISTILTSGNNVFGESGTLVMAMQLQRDLEVDLFQWVYLPIS